MSDYTQLVLDAPNVGRLQVPRWAGKGQVTLRVYECDYRDAAGKSLLDPPRTQAIAPSGKTLLGEFQLTLEPGPRPPLAVSGAKRVDAASGGALVLVLVLGETRHRLLLPSSRAASEGDFFEVGWELSDGAGTSESCLTSDRVVRVPVKAPLVVSVWARGQRRKTSTQPGAPWDEWELRRLEGRLGKPVTRVNLFGYTLRCSPGARQDARKVELVRGRAVHEDTGFERKVRELARDGRLLASIVDVTSRAVPVAPLLRILEQPALTKLLVERIAETAAAYHGVDLDLETVTLSAWRRARQALGKGFLPSFEQVVDRYHDLVDALAARLHRDGKQLSLTVGARTRPSRPKTEGDRYDRYRKLLVGGQASYLVIMGYGQGGPTSAPQACGPLDWLERVLRYAVEDENIPGEKIYLGIGLHGYDWEKEKRPGERHWKHKCADPALTEEGYAPRKGEATREYTTADGVARVSWVQTPGGLAAKCDLARRWGLAGVCLWNYFLAKNAHWQALAPVARDASRVAPPTSKAPTAPASPTAPSLAAGSGAGLGASASLAPAWRCENPTVTDYVKAIRHVEANFARKAGKAMDQARLVTELRKAWNGGAYSGFKFDLVSGGAGDALDSGLITDDGHRRLLTGVERVHTDLHGCIDLGHTLCGIDVTLHGHRRIVLEVVRRLDTWQKRHAAITWAGDVGSVYQALAADHDRPHRSKESRDAWLELEWNKLADDDDLLGDVDGVVLGVRAAFDILAHGANRRGGLARELDGYYGKSGWTRARVFEAFHRIHPTTTAPGRALVQVFLEAQKVFTGVDEGLLDECFKRWLRWCRERPLGCAPDPARAPVTPGAS